MIESHAMLKSKPQEKIEYRIPLVPAPGPGGGWRHESLHCSRVATLIAVPVLRYRRTSRGRNRSSSLMEMVDKGMNRVCVLSVFAMVSNGVDTVPLCWHASQCPWHRRGRCLFRHRVDDVGVKQPMTRTEVEIGAELTPSGRQSARWRPR